MKKELLKSYMCPVCGKYEFDRHGSFDFCEVCGWCDDLVQEMYPNDGIYNPDTLNGYRALYTVGLHRASDEEKAKWFKETGFLKLSNKERKKWLEEHGYYKI